MMKNFYLITNGCDVVKKQQNIDIRARFGIYDQFVFTYVGNVSDCKNQKQFVDAFCLLPDRLKQKITVLFVGGGDYMSLSDYIKSKGLSEKLIVCGLIDKDEVFNYYIAANATVLISLSEGFGLSLIEGFVYGKPALVFEDLAAVTDLYDEDSMYAVKSRSNEALAEGIKKMLEIKWNCDAICMHAQKFSLQNMATNYINLYKKLQK